MRNKNEQRRLTGAAVAPLLLLLCAAVLSPMTAAHAQGKQDAEKNDDSTRSVERSVERSSDSSSSRSDNSSSSSNSSSSNSSSSSSSNNSSSNDSSSSSSSSSSSNHDYGSSSSNDSGSSSRNRSGGNEGKRGGGGGGGGRDYNEGRNRNREHPGRVSDGDLGSRKRDNKDKDDDRKRGDNSYEDDTWRDDPANRNASGQSGNYQDECQRGYEEGLRVGASDARRGQTNDPYRSRHYQRGGGGFWSWGRSDAVKQAYRDCFLRGYQEGFQNPNLH